MRREKTHKICANHYLIPSLKLAPNVGSDRSWVWTATDFSEEAPTVELLAIRFATPESALRLFHRWPHSHAISDAKEFKEKFENCQKEMNNMPTSPQKPADKPAEKPADKPVEKPADKPAEHAHHHTEEKK